MRASGWTIVIAACILGAQTGPAAAQHPGPASPRSTATGVYTIQQAALGRDIYVALCQSCHTPASHTGPVFTNTWMGQLLSELFSYVREKMPKDNPGTLSRQEYAQVVAYLLKLNGMPAGASELPSETAALKQIRIDTTAAEPPESP